MIPFDVDGNAFPCAVDTFTVEHFIVSTQHNEAKVSDNMRNRVTSTSDDVSEKELKSLAPSCSGWRKQFFLHIILIRLLIRAHLGLNHT